MSTSHCPQGHAYAGSNLYTDSSGSRHCLTCSRDRKCARRRAAAEHRYLESWGPLCDRDAGVLVVPLDRGTNGWTVVDLEDLELISTYPGWRLINGYARTELRSDDQRSYIYMHRLVLDAPAGVEVDHANRDRLDNRRSNLRLATRAQQSANVGLKADNTSGYRGVSRTRSGRWGAWIRVAGRSRSLGTFASREAAARAYDAAALAAFGEFAFLNFPEVAA